jgi:hypothetical protein
LQAGLGLMAIPGVGRNADNFKDAVLADFSDFEANSLQTGRKRQMID